MAGHKTAPEAALPGVAPAGGGQARKAFPLRLPADLLAAMQRWADDELRSLNAQIEYVLRDSLRRHARLKAEDRTQDGGARGGS